MILTCVDTFISAFLEAATLQPLYNMVRYNTVLYITRFKDGSQKCIDYIVLGPGSTHLVTAVNMWSFFNIIFTFLFGYNTVVGYSMVV